MKKNLILFTLSFVALVACDGIGQSDSLPSNSAESSNVSSSDSSSSAVALPSLKQVMTNLANLRNYTYEMEDKIFNVTTTMYFTEKAFYYSPSQKEHGGDPYGYAQSNNNEVFSYVIENGKVVPGYVEKNKDGAVIKDLWKEKIISFYDFRLDTLPDDVTENNTYQITDESNKLLFAALAGYGDAFVSQFITVSVEVIGENAIKSIVHFEPENPTYTGDCIGVVKNIGTTEISEIATYLSEGKGPKKSDSEAIIDFLSRIKESKAYRIEVNRGEKSYVDILQENYYYSLDENNTTDQKGYLVLNERIYQFTIKEENVVISNEITYTSSNKSDLWSQGLFKNLSNINLTSVNVTEQEDGTLKMDYDVSSMSTLYGLTHDTSFFFSVNESDYIVFDKPTETSLTYTYHRNDGTSVSATISFDDVSNKIVENYIEKGGDIPEPNDISVLKEKITTLATSKNYTIDVLESISFPPTGFTKTGNKTITYTENSYYQENKTTSTSSFGYTKYEDGIYKVGSNKEKGECVQTENPDLYACGLFKSLSDINIESLNATQNLDKSYTITDSDILSLFLDIAGYDGKSGVTTFNSASVTISDETVTIKISGGFYGSITLTIK